MNDTATTVYTASITRDHLHVYRHARTNGDAPTKAARELMVGAAFYLADQTLTRGEPNEWAVENYRVAKAIYDAVGERMAYGTERLTYVSKTPRERYWAIGRLGRAS